MCSGRSYPTHRTRKRKRGTRRTLSSGLFGLSGSFFVSKRPLTFLLGATTRHQPPLIYHLPVALLFFSRLNREAFDPRIWSVIAGVLRTYMPFFGRARRYAAALGGCGCARPVFQLLENQPPPLESKLLLPRRHKSNTLATAATPHLPSRKRTPVLTYPHDHPAYIATSHIPLPAAAAAAAAPHLPDEWSKACSRHSLSS